MSHNRIDRNAAACRRLRLVKIGRAQRRDIKRENTKTMKTYKCVWEIDVPAVNSKEAAKRALEIQRDPNSTATVFFVFIPGSKKSTWVDVRDNHG